MSGYEVSTVSFYTEVMTQNSNIALMTSLYSGNVNANKHSRSGADRVLWEYSTHKWRYAPPCFARPRGHIVLKLLEVSSKPHRFSLNYSRLGMDFSGTKK